MPTAKNLNKMFWIESGLRASFVSAKSYGVVSDCGKFALSEDGISPSVFHRMSHAKEIALYCEGFKGHGWIEIFNK